MNQIVSEIKRLNFERAIWIVFILLSLLNIAGDDYDELYLKTNHSCYKSKSNYIFTFTLIIGIYIYLYFLTRNISIYALEQSDNKSLLGIKVIGSLFLLLGSILLLYFQKKQTNFTGSPAI